ncbi:MAG TPA: hypothetical protein VM261_28150 [Kofleriaceae bacterium]|nr:hypothetical protein [Kofleriaceae bacterium]
MRALVALVVIAAGAAAAVAEPVVVTPAQIELEAAWTGAEVTPEPLEGAAWVVRTNRDALLTVTKAKAGNTAAWRSATREKYLDDVEAGLVAGAGAGAEKLAAKRGKVGRDNVPVLDVVLRRRSPAGATEIVAVRVLLFRTVTVAAAGAAPDTRSGRKLVEGAVTKLVPR